MYKLSNETRNKIIADYLEGIKIKEIAQKNSCGTMSVIRIVKECGCPKRNIRGRSEEDKKLKKQQENHEACRRVTTRFYDGKRQAAAKNLIWDLSFQDYCKLIESGVCHYCGGRLSETGSGLDRKDNNLGYTFNNCSPCCWNCNNTFSNRFNYEEKLILSESLRKITHIRNQKLPVGSI